MNSSFTATAAQKNEVEINLTLVCHQTNLGETVRVTGNSTELGNWNPAKATGLITGPTEFPKWKTTIKIATAD